MGSISRIYAAFSSACALTDSLYSFSSSLVHHSKWLLQSGCSLVMTKIEIHWPFIKKARCYPPWREPVCLNSLGWVSLSSPPSGLHGSGARTEGLRGFEIEVKRWGNSYTVDSSHSLTWADGDGEVGAGLNIEWVWMEHSCCVCSRIKVDSRELSSTSSCIVQEHYFTVTHRPTIVPLLD